MTDGRRRVLFAPGRVRTSERGPSGIRITPPPSQPPGGQGRGGGQGGGRGTGRGHGAGLANLQQLVAALGAISSTSGKVVPSPPDVPGALTLLATQNPSAGSNISFASISQAYSDLIVVLIGRSAGAGTTNSCTVRFNSDTGSNYITELGSFAGAAPASAGVNGTSWQCSAALPGAGGTASYFGLVEFAVCGYSSTSFFKPAISNVVATATNAAQRAEVNDCVWISTAAVTQIDLITFGGFAAGSTARLYGRS